VSEALTPCWGSFYFIQEGAGTVPGFLQWDSGAWRDPKEETIFAHEVGKGVLASATARRAAKARPARYGAMVCSKCEKKLSRGIHQEMWKEGSRHTLEGGGRALNENKALSAKKRWTPYGSSGSGTGGGKCKICKTSLHQEGIYCQKCAYSKGMCSMCGVQVMDITFYNIGSDDWNAAKKGDGSGGAAGAGAEGGDVGALLLDGAEGGADDAAEASEAAEEAAEAEAVAAEAKAVAKKIQVKP